ncbi:MAG: amidohydrolase family protein [Lentisphaerae bacterium]|nr:amidohydrolase family protein [Lentisphaerota bacterium]
MKRTTIIRNIRRQSQLIDVHTHVGTDPANFLRGDFPYAQSAEDLVVRMDRWGVDTAVCFPFLYTSYFDMAAFNKGRMLKRRSKDPLVPYGVENARLCQEIYEAYPACAGRLLPFMFMDPSRDPAGQVEQLERLADQYPVFGLKTATSYLQSHITDLLGKGECLLDFASEHNVPFMLHTSVAPGDPWANVHTILDVVRKRQDVRFCLAHTCRFDRDALEQAAALPNCYVDYSAFHIHCDLVKMESTSVAAKPHRFPTAYRQCAKAMAAIATAYPDTMMWGTDSPYYCFMSRFTDDKGHTQISKLKCDTDAEITTFRKLPATMQRRIGYDNTIRFLFGNKGEPAT